MYFLIYLLYVIHSSNFRLTVCVYSVVRDGVHAEVCYKRERWAWLEPVDFCGLFTAGQTVRETGDVTATHTTETDLETVLRPRYSSVPKFTSL